MAELCLEVLLSGDAVKPQFNSLPVGISDTRGQVPPIDMNFAALSR